MIVLHLTPIDSINESIKSYPLETPLTVYLSKGIYDEKIYIYHHYLKLIGESKDETIIRYHDYSYKMHEDGLLYNTFRTSTLTIFGDYVHLENLTICNTSGSSPMIGQAIALSLYGNHTYLSNCIIDGHQDSLFIGPLPDDLIERYDDFLLPEQLKSKPLVHHFDSCIIRGDVDFIFGSGTAFFEKCHIISKAKGYICAPSTKFEIPYGFVFYQSIIENLSNDAIILARPWRDFGSTIFIECNYIGLITDQRFDDWGKTNYRFFEAPYISSPLSKELNEEEKEQLIKLIHDVAAPKQRFKN